MDGFVIDWLCCRIASAPQRQQQQSYWCYWAAVRYNPIYTWHKARLGQITPNPIRWRGAQHTELLTLRVRLDVPVRVCVCAFMPMCTCVCTIVGEVRVLGGIKITTNDLHFSLHWNTSSVSNDCYLLSPSPLTLLMYSSFSPPFTGLTHSPTLSLYLAVFFPPSLLPLPSLLSLCYTV